MVLEHMNVFRIFMNLVVVDVKVDEEGEVLIHMIIASPSTTRLLSLWKSSQRLNSGTRYRNGQFTMSMV